MRVRCLSHNYDHTPLTIAINFVINVYRRIYVWVRIFFLSRSKMVAVLWGFSQLRASREVYSILFSELLLSKVKA